MSPREERDVEGHRHRRRIIAARAERIAQRTGESLRQVAKRLRDDRAAAWRAAHGEITPAAALRSVDRADLARQVRR